MGMQNLHQGDEVYWSDPDEGTCSGYGYFVEYLNEEAATIRKDGGIIEVYISELS